MNILLINQYAGNLDLGMEFRPYYFAREWKREGHHVVCIAGSYSHLRQSNEQSRFSIRWKSTYDGVNYDWLWTPRYPGNGVRRALNIMTFALELELFAAKLSKMYKPDIVISSSTHNLDFWGARRIARLSNAVHVHEVHDLWPLTLYEAGGMNKSHPWIRLLQVAEDAAYRGSDVVVSIPPDTLEYMSLHGLEPKKFVHIPNGVASEDWESHIPIPELHQNAISRIHRSGKLVVGYAGSIGPLNELRSLLDAGRAGLNGAEIVLVGDGLARAELQREYEGPGITFLPKISKRQIPALIEQFDVCFAGLWSGDSRTSGTSLNKLFDYMMAGRPILFGADTSDSVVSRAEAGITVPAEDSVAVRETINEFVRMTEDERNIFGNRAREYAISHFEHKVLAQQFLDEIQSRRIGK